MAQRQVFADGIQGSIVPSRKELQWSQLKVGILVLVGVAVLIGLVFLMSGSTGGLFTRKLVLRSYFANASGLKGGAPVSLEGVTIGNITGIHIVPARNPTPVEVTMQVSEKAAVDLHTDSTTSIQSAGVLGDSFLDISSKEAHGPAPANNAELAARNVPSIQAVVDTSQEALQKAALVMTKVNTLLDTLNSKKGTAGLLLNDPQIYSKAVALLNNAEEITRSIGQGKGTLGKLLTDETMYTKINATVDRLNTITESLAEGHGSAGKLLHDDELYNRLNDTSAKLQQITTDLNNGKGSAGKLLKDETLYTNLNSTLKHANDLLAEADAGRGALGLLTKDPKFAKKLDDTVTQMDTLLTNVNTGQGTIGKLAKDPSMYNNLNTLLTSSTDLVQAVRKDPKKYLVIHLKIF